MTPHEPSCRCWLCEVWWLHSAVTPTPPPPRLAAVMPVGPDGYSAPEPDEEAARDEAFLRSLGITPRRRDITP